MKISYNWLKEYVNIDLPADEVARILTDTGLEVEGLEKVEAVKGGLKGVVVGEVVECERHPDADRLNVTKVNVGGKELLNIVCGAPNVAVGQKVVVATVGCTLYPDPEKPFKIKRSKIRGIESEGMLCAEDELGLGEGHDGIMELAGQTEVGIPAANYFDLEDDYLIEIGLTPNRSDAMGHIGVARDLIAYLNVHEGKNLKLNLPEVNSFAIENSDLPISVVVEDHEACPRYMGVSIKGVSVKPSPEWLQKRLRSIGLSPINNVVDVTNFVMHELGNPLHAFDADKLNGKIVVKKANTGDKFTTLDEVERSLDQNDLMITNGSEHLCIAGVFGGLDSGIVNNTTDVFLESAYFNPVSVRKTAKRHALNTDSSFRFERGVDPEMTAYAMKRAAILIKEVAGGSIAMEIADEGGISAEQAIIEFEMDRCRKLIGASITNEMIKSILVELDFEILDESGDKLSLKVPMYRVDVHREADVVEEVLRIYGYNNVPVPSKLNSSITYSSKPNREKVKTVVSELLVGMGFVETLNNSLTKASYTTDLGGEVLRHERIVELLNPLSQDLSVMRQTLIFNLLETIEHNQNRQNPDLRLFEYGKVYHKFDSGYSENQRLMLGITGERVAENWNSTSGTFDFYSMKGFVTALLERLGLDSFVSFKALKKSLLKDGMDIYVLKQKVGEIGWISGKQRKHFGIKNEVFVADLDWDALIDSLKLTGIKYKELPKSFAVRRDFSLLLDEKVTFKEIVEVAHKCDKKILREVALFDVYEGDKLEQGKKSYAVSFTFQDDNQTLKDKQVDAVMEKIRKELEGKLSAQLRG